MAAALRCLAVLEAKKDEELDFHRGYDRKLDAVFAVLVKRFCRAEERRLVKARRRT